MLTRADLVTRSFIANNFIWYAVDGLVSVCSDKNSSDVGGKSFFPSRHEMILSESKGGTTAA
jgi:hypothetical protein